MYRVILLIAIFGGAFSSTVIDLPIPPQPMFVEFNRNKSEDGQIHYSLGGRVPGDHIIGHAAAVATYPTPQTALFEFGLEKPVTYVAIQVNQSSNLGKAFVDHGGVGHPDGISVLLEADDVQFVDYSAHFYGV